MNQHDAITTSYKKTVASTVVSQIFEAQCQSGQVPTRTLQTRSNHVFMAIYVTVKREYFGIANKLNVFVLHRQLLINASRSAQAQLLLFRSAA